jgi:anti-sigma B factor antagonist
MPSEEFLIDDSKASDDNVAIIRLTGPLTLGGVFRYQQTFRATTAPSVIVDMTDVPYADSAGIGSLVLSHVSCQKAGRKLALVGVSARPREVMRVTRVDQLFAFYPSVQEAEQKLAATA